MSENYLYLFKNGEELRAGVQAILSSRFTTYTLLPLRTGKYVIFHDDGFSYVAIGKAKEIFCKTFYPVIITQVNTANKIIFTGKYFIHGTDIAVAYAPNEQPLIALGKKCECYSASTTDNFQNEIKGHNERLIYVLIILHQAIVINDDGMPEIVKADTCTKSLLQE
jgi:hypothetical protein